MTTWRFRQGRQTAVPVEAAQSRAAIPLLRRDGEAGVAHPEWSKDSSLQHRAQGCAVEARDQEPEQVGRVTVVEAGAWLVDQRQRRQARDPRVRRERVVDLRAERLRMRASDRAAMKVPIRQPGAMRQQIAERDRTRRLVGLIEWTIRVA